MSSLRPVEPGDLVDVTARLREVMAVHDNGGFVLNASFAELGAEFEAEAVKTRHTLQLAAARVATFCRLIEEHPLYRAAIGSEPEAEEEEDDA